MRKLDEEKKYTVCLRPVTERMPYFPETGDVCEMEFDFKPVKKGNVRAFNISDAHNLIEEPIKAARNYIKENGELDFLILNGDVANDSSELGNFDTIYSIASELTQGGIPIVYSKGNHENRGFYADKLSEYTPHHNNNSYYTFKLGNIWGLILDCGEDKPDSHEEYGNTVCFEHFRAKQTKYIERIVADELKKYKNDEIVHKIIVCHIPFTRKHKPPFDIEEELYSHWARLIKDGIKPDIMLCGHEHKAEVIMPGGAEDVLGHPCPLVIGSIPRIFHVEEKSFVGTGIEFLQDSIRIKFTSSIDEENRTVYKDSTEIKCC